MKVAGEKCPQIIKLFGSLDEISKYVCFSFPMSCEPGRSIIRLFSLVMLFKASGCSGK